MASKAKTVEEYFDEIPADRLESIKKIREAMRESISPDFEEGMQYGMIGYYVPHSRYPKGYHCDPKQPLPFAHLANMKGHIGIYLFCVYMDSEHRDRFIEDWKKTGKKLDMGKACIRVKSSDDVPFEVLKELLRGISVERFVQTYESALSTPRKK
jgi:uncharacterized protein YdhG (YjbR/CyaY superfamily)